MKGDWYFDGYEGRTSIGPDGRQHRELVYTGEYYGFARGQNITRMKLLFTVLILVHFACCSVNAMSSCMTARTPYIGIPLMLSMAPGVYLALGTACFLPAKEEMTARTAFASLRRMSRALRIMAPLAAICIIGCFVRMILAPEMFSSPEDMRCLICAVIGSAAVIFEFFFLLKNPVVIVREPSPDSARAEELEKKKKEKEDKEFRKKNNQ